MELSVTFFFENSYKEGNCHKKNGEELSIQLERVSKPNWPALGVNFCLEDDAQDIDQTLQRGLCF